jgi:hypothetical protein
MESAEQKAMELLFSLGYMLESGVMEEEGGKEYKKRILEKFPEAENVLRNIRLVIDLDVSGQAQKKKVIRLHKYDPNWDLLKAGMQIRHREENKATGLVNEWVGEYRSPKEFIRRNDGTETVFKSPNAFLSAHLKWCIDNGKTNKSKNTGNAWEEIEYCASDGDWRKLDCIRHEVPHPASA